jgi:hypothetical protein
MLQGVASMIIQATLHYGLSRSRGQSRAQAQPAPAAGRGAV